MSFITGDVMKLKVALIYVLVAVVLFVIVLYDRRRLVKLGETLSPWSEELPFLIFWPVCLFFFCGLYMSEKIAAFIEGSKKDGEGE